jgi:hypothetical protein
VRVASVSALAHSARFPARGEKCTPSWTADPVPLLEPRTTNGEHVRRANQLAALVVVASAGCYSGLPGARSDGDDGAESATNATAADDDDDDGSGDDGAPPPADAGQVGKSGMRRLTANEYDNTLRDLLVGDEAQSQLLLPNDPRTPFDNGYADQEPSQALVEGADLLAADAADRLLADPPRRDLVIGCVPTGPGDEACMRDFVTRFGRRVLRRPLADDEIETLLHGESGDDGALDHAIEAADFYTGIDSLLRTLLQDPQFLYRIERGEPVDGDPGLFKLNDFEVATRLSYFVWGSGPDDALLDLAEAGGLSDPDAVREVTIGMLADERAIDRIDRFHALWLGYEQMQFGGELADAMRQETRGLLERIVFEEQRPWQDVFRLDETLVDDTLAAHYGLAPPGSDTPVWVPYDMPERRGLLAHGTFLSVGFKQNDTNVVRRGLQVRRLLLCEDIPPPPPTVDVDAVPEGVCKVDKSAAHAQGGCAGCHDLIDPVGFGLENFDSQGRYRTHEPDDPLTEVDESVECEIPGAGNLVGIGEFHGPAQLADLAIGSGMLDACVVEQLYRWSTGRAELDELDLAFIEHIATELEGGDFRFDELVLDFVGHEAFGYRREESAP